MFLSIVFSLAAAASATAVPGAQVRYAITAKPEFPDPVATAKRNDYVVLQPYLADRARELRAANPSLKIYVYKNFAFAPDLEPRNKAISSGVSIQQARDNGWVLRAPNGKELRSRGWNYNVALDVGDPGYQRAWVEHVASELRKGPWDGVFIDDVNTTNEYHFDHVPAYPTDASYQRAVGSMLTTIRGPLAATGKLSIANLAASSQYPAVARGWLGKLDGMMEEMFTRYGDGADTTPQWIETWKQQVAMLEYAQQQGKYYLGVSHALRSDRTAARYGYASLLLAASNQRAAFGLHETYDLDTATIPELSWDMGRPLGARSTGADGVVRRTFSRGLVVVNPTEQAVLTSVGSGYVNAAGRATRRVRLQPNSAVILRTRGGSAAAKRAARAKAACARPSSAGLRARRKAKLACARERCKASVARSQARTTRAAKGSYKFCVKRARKRIHRP